MSLTLEAHDEYWGGRPPLKRIRFVEVPEVSSRINGLLVGRVPVRLRHPAGPDRRHREERDVRGPGRPHPQPPPDRVRQEPRAARQSAGAAAFTHAIDRQAIVDSLWAGRTRVPPGLQWEFYGDMFIADWSVPAYDPPSSRRSCLKRPTTRAIRSRIACSTITTPTRSRPRRCWSRCGSGRPQRRDREQGELVADHGARNDPCGARLVERALRSTTRSPRWSPSMGRTASSSRSANGPMRR